MCSARIAARAASASWDGCDEGVWGRGADPGIREEDDLAPADEKPCDPVGGRGGIVGARASVLAWGTGVDRPPRAGRPGSRGAEGRVTEEGGTLGRVGMGGGTLGRGGGEGTVCGPVSGWKGGAPGSVRGGRLWVTASSTSASSAPPAFRREAGSSMFGIVISSSSSSSPMRGNRTSSGVLWSPMDQSRTGHRRPPLAPHAPRSDAPGCEHSVEGGIN